MFLPEPDLGDYKTINGETYLNPWINYTLPKPIQVSLVIGPVYTCYKNNAPSVLTRDCQLNSTQVYLKQESRAAARKSRDAASVLFG